MKFAFVKILRKKSVEDFIFLLVFDLFINYATILKSAGNIIKELAAFLQLSFQNLH